MKKYKQLEKRRKEGYYQCPRNTGTQWTFLPRLLQGASDSLASAQGPIHKPATKDSSLKSLLKLQADPDWLCDVEVEHLEKAISSFTYDEVTN